MDPGGRYSQIPIPSYEEAISSRPGSSQYRGPQEVSDDAERQGLLNESGYQPPTVESARSSVDSDLQLPEVNGEDDRRQIEELDYLDPEGDARGGIYHRARLRSQFSKRLANISATLSSLRLPFRSLYTPVANDDDNNTTEPTPIRTSDDHPRRPWLPQISNPWHSIPEQYRLSAPTFARLCGLFTILALVYVLFALDMLPNGARQIGAHFDPESVRMFVQENVNARNIQDYLRHITSYDHVAGTEGDLYLAKWMENIWLESEGFDDMAMWEYWVYLNYPTKDGRGVKIVEPAAKKWDAVLEEEQVDVGKTQTWSWHGHSRSGEAKGHLVYANEGRREDFEWLKKNDVDTKGCIALIRYANDMQPGLQVMAAEEAGCVGALLFSAPAGDGETWPDSPFRPPDSVQRADVAISNWVLGDPLTPGHASRQNARRENVLESPSLPKIPSLPLPWRDTEAFIDALLDVGTKVPDKWNVGSSSNKGQAWFSGSKDAKGAPIVEMRNRNEESTKQRIWNLHALLKGLEQPQKKIIVGARRDAWCFGSATGTAILMEVASIFTELRKLQWRPLRSIEFVSWDAGMFGAVGATEYVEDNIGYLRDNGVAYLNVDPGVFGSDFVAEGSPLMRKALQHVLGRVVDPGKNATLKQEWRNNQQNKLQGLSTSSEPSDALPFQSLSGTSVLDFGFKHDDPTAYPQGSCYESLAWMRKFGDMPDFSHHSTIAQIWALLILEIADRPLIPFDLRVYAETIQNEVKKLEDFAIKSYRSLDSKRHPKGNGIDTLTDGDFSLSHLHSASAMLMKAAKNFHKFEEEWSSFVMADGGLETAQWAFKRLDWNSKISHFETDLLDLAWDYGDDEGGDGMSGHGPPGREQFKHVVWGPRAWTSESPVFPGIRDAIGQGDWKLAHKIAQRAARVIRRAARELWEDPECEVGEWCD